MRFFIGVLGWYGALAILAAYALVSFEVLAPTSPWYHVLNGTGALGIVVHALSKKELPAAILNIAWVLVALAALVTILF